MIQQIDPTIEKDSKELKLILDRLKELEYEGYQFEGANASLELVIKKALGLYHPLFELKQCKILAEQGEKPRQGYASVIIKVQVDGKEEITAADADGPVHALDIALRKALGAIFSAACTNPFAGLQGTHPQLGSDHPARSRAC